MASTAALGFRLHTGWAALVAIAGTPGKFQVLLRRRIKLLPRGDSVPRFVYHKAAELPLSEAVELVSRAEAASEESARTAMKEVLDHLGSLAVEVKAGGIPCSSRPVPTDLSAVLRAHPMIHTAEGVLFQRAVTSACQVCGLAVISAREREVWRTAASSWSLTEEELRQQVDGLRKSVGAPWGTDQKTATAFALLALREVTDTERGRGVSPGE
ncbi:MAG TPA: hypothetical protein VJP02_09700 [Candidatus Sulfotelmatobacter sp.]|nr:hypothetical protein [Candidatus Sulfotelmatobacter sp.]